METFRTLFNCGHPSDIFEYDYLWAFFLEFSFTFLGITVIHVGDRGYCIGRVKLTRCWRTILDWNMEEKEIRRQALASRNSKTQETEKT